MEADRGVSETSPLCYRCWEWPLTREYEDAVANRPTVSAEARERLQHFGEELLALREAEYDPSVGLFEVSDDRMAEAIQEWQDVSGPDVVLHLLGDLEASETQRDEWQRLAEENAYSARGIAETAVELARQRDAALTREAELKRLLRLAIVEFPDERLGGLRHLLIDIGVALNGPLEEPTT